MLRIAVIAAAVLSLAVPGARALSTHETHAPTVTHVVRPGETLWQIARTLRPEDDPRATVGAILEATGVRSALVRPGQTLRLPAR